MEGLYNEIILSITGLVVTGLGLGMRYMITKLQEIVPREEIQSMISTQIEKSEIKDESITGRLSRMEQQLDMLLGLMLKDGARHDPQS